MNNLFCLCAKVAILVGSPVYKSDMLRWEDTITMGVGFIPDKNKSLDNRMITKAS